MMNVQNKTLYFCQEYIKKKIKQAVHAVWALTTVIPNVLWNSVLVFKQVISNQELENLY